METYESLLANPATTGRRARQRRPIGWLTAALLFATLLTPSPSAAFGSEARSPEQVTSASNTVIQTAWLPYDYAKITTAQKCENRRNWLIKNVAWINSGNSMCQRFVRSQCPTTYYWMVMVQDKGTFRSTGERSSRNSAQPAALSEGHTSTLSC
ncbi:hypothetical protein M3A96_10400 [Helcobacillus massiliensis]|uniref:hypothetical protein n=1 Tax=Helcobacillus massiliensis TaxID=521392 RepID=UPI0021A7F97E|nr:hypothetical protein [Helcobacillus massiliensis]MCT1558521.1 hypothetical protein [Helcobacillus massiliensis]MCT2036060.1 hypothetical protein [Helcobacillus massiliensis]MCT2332760.1 hypothetical protein [Helcobacillus massiliensis]